jgi:predicted metal-dependent HD superfamily phosphohydrolase
MCTKYHFSETEYDDLDLNYMLDFDLYTFGLPFEDYAKINEGIVYEFTHHINMGEFVKGRTGFLNLVLKKSIIYRTSEFYDKYEVKAMENINKEIEMLSKFK